MRWPWSKRTEKHAMNLRGFASAQTDRLVARWRFDGGFTPSEVSAYLSTIRGRSRQAQKDFPHYRRWLQLVSTNVVGEGFALKSTPHDGEIGAPSWRIDEQAARVIEWHWWRFCNYRDPETGATWFDATGRKTAAEMDRLNAKTWARDGEYFIHVLPAANPYGVTFRVLRPDLCDHTYNLEQTATGNIIHAGVEVTADTRRPIAYWFHTIPKAAHAWNMYGQPVLRIPAGQIIHGYTQEDEEQPRGIPWAHATLVKLMMLDEYDRAELTAARDEACSVRTYYAPDGNGDVFRDLTDPTNQEAANALIADKEPGQSEILPSGYRSEVHTPAHPNREVTAFKSSMQRDIASGLGVEYANAFNDWSGVSFSSVRLGTISERDHWTVLQNQMISQAKTPMFLAWLKSFLKYAVSGNLPAAKYDKFAEHEFRGRRWMWVDPMKDVNAATVAVEHGWKTNTDIAADMGSDYADNVETIKREKALAGPPAPGVTA